MAPVKLEGHTLGEKHRSYNKIIKESIKENLKDIESNENDINNLVKVDLASKDRNLDYILGILKGNDMLYVSRAISQSPWLITDNTYAHIINPEYLNTELAPVIMPKAFNKLMLHVRLNLRDEARIENFFNYYKEVNLTRALKWLPHCSETFIENNVEKYWKKINPRLLKRLCEKTHRSLEVYVKNSKHNRAKKHFQATLFLIRTHTDFYLDLLETLHHYELPELNARMTKILMKLRSKRVQNKFSKYAYKIHIPTFVKYLDDKEIEDFLITQANLEKGERYSTWMNYNNLQHFIKRMPQAQRVCFIREVFLKKDSQDARKVPDDSSTDDLNDSENQSESKNDKESGLNILSKLMKHYDDPCYWTVFLPFDVALDEVNEKIKNKIDEHDTNNLLLCLARIVGHDLQHLETLLQYYIDNHLKGAKHNNNFEFVTCLLKSTNLVKYDSKCWSLLTNIFNAMNIYNEKSEREYSDCNSDVHICIKAIIAHEVINKEEVSKIIEKQFKFESLSEYQRNVNSEEKKLLFTYLHNFLLTKIEKQNFEEYTSFKDNLNLIHSMLYFLKDWKKNLADYPYVLNKIRELIKTNQANSSKDNLCKIYNINKSWRKYMFEESIVLCASEEVCINALKHDANLLSRNENVISVMRSNNTASLKRLLMKIKVYWPDSITTEWSQAYRENLNQPIGHKATMRGLSILLPQRELSEIINKYRPDDMQINWEETDEVLISLRKHIAMNMHLARPQPTPDHILQYAKGDYLQFALPSLNSICYNLCTERSQELIPKLLDSPVSLQKHGIRLAFTKLQSEELQKIFSNYWKTVKNLSIRAVIFKLTYCALCKEKDPEKIDIIWGLLELFIDGLGLEEDKTIYERLTQVRTVPLRVRHLFVMKTYKFIRSLVQKSDLDKNKYENHLNSLIPVIDELIESIEPEFVSDILQEYFTAVYTKDRPEGFVHKDLSPLMASYLTCPESEEIQIQRYKTVLLPVLKETFNSWAETDKNNIVKTNLRSILRGLQQKLKISVRNHKIVPVAMHAHIQKELDQSLKQNGAYLLVKEWKLTAAFTEVINNSKVSVDYTNFDNDENKYWDAICMKAAPQYGKMCLEFLKDDIKSYFPSIDEYFSKALATVLRQLLNIEAVIEVLKHMLAEDVIQSYLVAIRVLPTYYQPSDGDNKLLDLHKEILSHPSLEVKMHFFHQNTEYKYKSLF